MNWKEPGGISVEFPFEWDYRFSGSALITFKFLYENYFQTKVKPSKWNSHQSVFFFFLLLRLLRFSFDLFLPVIFLCVSECVCVWSLLLFVCFLFETGHYCRAVWLSRENNPASVSHVLGLQVWATTLCPTSNFSWGCLITVSKTWIVYVDTLLLVHSFLFWMLLSFCHDSFEFCVLFVWW